MVTWCDYIYILCGDTYIMNVMERRFFFAKPEHRKTIHEVFLFLFFVFSFLFTVVMNKD